MACGPTRSIETGRSKLDSAIRVAVTTMVESSVAISPEAPAARAPKPSHIPTDTAAIPSRMIAKPSTAICHKPNLKDCGRLGDNH